MMLTSACQCSLPRQPAFSQICLATFIAPLQRGDDDPPGPQKSLAPTKSTSQSHGRLSFYCLPRYRHGTSRDSYGKALADIRVAPLYVHDCTELACRMTRGYFRDKHSFACTGAAKPDSPIRPLNPTCAHLLSSYSCPCDSDGPEYESPTGICLRRKVRTLQEPPPSLLYL